ncbi:MAG TPA: STAS domain-containing protein [Chthoniobacterales bacterium]
MTTTPPAEVFVPNGEIDLDVAARVNAALCAILAKQPKRLVVDLTNVNYLDSAGLAVLIRGMQDARDYGGEFFLAAMREELLPIFQMACLDTFFRIFPDVRSALVAE